MSSKKDGSTILRGGLKKDALLILQKLGEHFTQAEISYMTRFTKGGVNYYVKKFLKEHLITEQGTKYPKYYDLTPKGQAILTRSELPRIPCQMEDYAMKFRLIQDFGGLSWEKLGSPKNWVKMGVKIGHVSVEKNLGTIPTIIIHTGQLVGFHPDHCLLEAGGIIADVKTILRGFGVLVDDVGLPLRKPIFKFFTKEAEKFHEKLGNITTDSGTIDNSYPRVPHVEYTRETAVNYIEAPDRIARIEERLNAIAAVQDKIVSLFEAVLNGEPKKPSVEVTENVVTYIS